ncbi:MAG: oligopeptide transporter, OPT family [Elusimicrobia bacterium]|nr:oligopeptide transporter, OPT family [Elusimicrobiota bacterium]
MSQAHEHKPFIPADSRIEEFTWPAVLVGAILGIVFGASSIYLVLKVGMTVSASIPVAVLSITLFRWASRLTGMRRATILENNIVQTTGSAGESIAFGVGVTMPALMILGYEMDMTRVMTVASLGGLLGVLMMIPLRRIFIVKQHGVLAYPEGTACADVLIVGEKGGSSAKTVFTGFGLAVLYKFLMSGLRLWKESPERLIPQFKGAAISGDVVPELLGVGYIIGTRISCVMVAGGILASWVLIPAIKLFGATAPEPLFPAVKLISEMEPGEVWKAYVLYIGAGAVAAGGIISLLQSFPTILASLKSGLSDIAAGAKSTVKAATTRTEDDMPNKVVLGGSLAIILAVAATPQLGLGFGLSGILGGILIVLFGFMFVTVSSRLTGEIGSSSNPVSGMTVATLLITCLFFLLLSKFDPTGGWMGKGARLSALTIAAIVCIAASNAGGTSQDLKTGFLVGATPKYQQWGLLVGTLSSAVVIGFTLLILNDAGTVYAKRDFPGVKAPVETLTRVERLKGPGSEADQADYKVWHLGEGEAAGIPAGKYLVDDAGTVRYLVDPGINGVESVRLDGTTVQKYNAPKARLMSLIIDGILTQKLPWGLVLLGVAIALVLELCGVPSLPFAVGVYLPLSASTPIFAGGVIRWLADRWAGKEGSDMSPGILFSSGYIAGGSIAGIAIALLSLAPKISESIDLSGALGAWTQSELTSLIAFGVISVLLLLVGAERWLREEPS